MIIVALGANLPGRYVTPRTALMAALGAIKAKCIKVLGTSHLWLTEPVPVSNQPWYHNAVITIETALSPYALLETLHQIESDFGRVRAERNAARVLDLDLIAYNDVIIDKPELIVPHPRMQDRAFVLYPMAEVVSGTWRHPLSGKTLDELLDAMPTQSAKREEVPFP